MDQLGEYADTVLALRDEYRKDIEIHLGLEVEYYPEYFGALLEAAKDYPIEYFIHAQHALDNEIGALYSGAETQDPQVLKRYTEQVKAAMDTGCFTYLAHPDLIHFTGDPAVYEQEMRTLCRHAKNMICRLKSTVWVFVKAGIIPIKCLGKSGTSFFVPMRDGGIQI